MKSPRSVIRRLGCAFALLPVLAAPVWAAEKKQSADLIVPGKAIGSVHLGQKLEELQHRWGEGQGDTSMGRHTESWPTEGGTLEVLCRRPDEHTFRVQKIRTTSPKFATVGGLSVGHTLAEVQQFYPKAKWVNFNEFGPQHKVLLVREKGLAFEFTGQKPEARCTAVVVENP